MTVVVNHFLHVHVQCFQGLANCWSSTAGVIRALRLLLCVAESCNVDAFTAQHLCDISISVKGIIYAIASATNWRMRGLLLHADAGESSSTVTDVTVLTWLLTFLCDLAESAWMKTGREFVIRSPWVVFEVLDAVSVCGSDSPEVIDLLTLACHLFSSRDSSDSKT